MARDRYDRYKYLKEPDGGLEPMPFVRISESESDKYEFWKLGLSKLPNLSKKYYGSPFYDFLILYANPQYLNEFDIPDGATIRIPFPLSRAKAEYEGRLEFVVNQQ